MTLKKLLVEIKRLKKDTGLLASIELKGIKQTVEAVETMFRDKRILKAIRLWQQIKEEQKIWRNIKK